MKKGIDALCDGNGWSLPLGPHATLYQLAPL
jgi:hypothetical protein